MFALADFLFIGKGGARKMIPIISAIISIAATVEGLVEPFFKKMKTVLLFNLLGNALVGVNYLLTASYSGAIICGVAILGLCINYYFTSQDKKIPVGAIIFHAVAFLAANLVTFTYWYDVLALAASLLFVLSIAQESTKYYRLLYISNSLVWIGYDVFAKSWGNLFTHSVLFIAIFISIIVRDGKKAETTK